MAEKKSPPPPPCSRVSLEHSHFPPKKRKGMGSVVPAIVEEKKSIPVFSSSSSSSSFSSLNSQEASPADMNRKPNKLLMLCDAIDFVEWEEYPDEKKKQPMNAKSNKVFRKRKDDSQKQPQDPPPAWVVQKFRDMGASDEHLNTMYKSITKSDIDRSQNRLLLPKHAVKSSNLLGQFQHLRDQIKSDEGLEVEVLDGEMRRYVMVLKYLKCNHDYRIIRPDWSVFVGRNRLNCTGDRVHLCMFYVPVGGGEKQQVRLGIVKEPS